MARGHFIVIEGGEASGKSTQAGLLARALGAELTREPGGTALGERTRELLLHSGESIGARAELLLMTAARAQHVEEKIRPALESGRDVVCDRFSASSIAYQGYGRGLPLEDVIVACELATDGLAPDLTVLVDVPRNLARTRLGGRPPDRFEIEEDDFHERVLAGFRAQAFADPKAWAVLDGSGTVEEVFDAVLKVVKDRLGLDVELSL